MNKISMLVSVYNVQEYVVELVNSLLIKIGIPQ